MEGPLNKGEEGLRVSDVQKDRIWDLHSISFESPSLLAHSIRAIPVRAASRREVHICWVSSSKGEFDSKNAYMLALGLSPNDPKFEGNWVWKLKTLPKIQLFVWKYLLQSIPTKSILAQRGFNGDTSCDWCHEDQETIAHVLRDCPIASSFWAEADCPSHLRYSFDLDTTEWLKLNAYSSALLVGKDQQWAIYFLFGIWNLWLCRNKRLFAKPSPFNLRKAVENQTAEYFFCVLDHAPVTRVKRFSMGWTKPQPLWTKLNTDGSALGSPGLAGGGGIIKDCHGEWISGFERSIGFTTSFAAEFWALRDGLMLCLNLGITAVEVEVDASSIVSLLANATETNSEIDSLVDDCRDMLKRIPQAQVKHCYSESNKCADRLARLGTDMEENFVVFDVPPHVIVSLLMLDKLGMTQERICNEVGLPT